MTQVALTITIDKGSIGTAAVVILCGLVLGLICLAVWGGLAASMMDVGPGEFFAMTLPLVVLAGMLGGGWLGYVWMH
jgi:hypothetical protein